MKSLDHLFILIKSLNKSEKRFFRLFSNFDRRNKNYLKLFIEIEKQKTYNELKIVEKYKNEKFAKNIAASKHYLTKAIIKCLIFYHYKDRDAQELFHLLAINVLKNKRNYFLQKKQIELAKGLFDKENPSVNRLALLIEEHSFEIIHSKDIYAMQKINDLYQEERVVLNELMIKVDLGNISSELNLNQRYYIESDTEKLKKYIQSKIFKEYHHYSSGLQKTLFYTKAIIYHEIGDLQMVNESFEQLRNLYESPGIVKENKNVDFTYNYIVAIRNSIISFLNISNLKPIPNLLKKYFLFKTHSSINIVFISNLLYHISFLEYCIASFQISDAIQQTIVIEKELLGRKRKSLSSHYTTQIDLLIAIVCFFNKDYKKSLKQLSLIYSEPKSNVNDKIVIILCDIVQILCYFELEKWDIIEYRIRALKRSDSNEFQPLKFQMLLFTFIEKWMNDDLGNKNSRHQQLSKLQRDIYKLMPIRDEAIAIQKLNLLKWIDLKMREYK